MKIFIHEIFADELELDTAAHFAECSYYSVLVSCVTLPSFQGLPDPGGSLALPLLGPSPSPSPLTTQGTSLSSIATVRKMRLEVQWSLSPA